MREAVFRLQHLVAFGINSYATLRHRYQILIGWNDVADLMMKRKAKKHIYINKKCNDNNRIIQFSSAQCWMIISISYSKIGCNSTYPSKYLKLIWSYYLNWSSPCAVCLVSPRKLEYVAWEQPCGGWQVPKCKAIPPAEGTAAPTPWSQPREPPDRRGGRTR